MNESTEITTPKAPTHTLVMAPNGVDVIEAPVSDSPPPKASYDADGKLVVKNAAPSDPSPATAAANREISSYFDVEALGETPDKTAHSDTFTFGPFQFFLRAVGAEIRAADDSFPLRAIRELGLDTRAAAELGEDFEGENRAVQIARRARLLLDSEAFRETEGLSRRFDALLHARFDAVILGQPDSESPAEWGGMVKWASRVMPFSEAAARALKLNVKVKVYERVMALSRYGIDDATFRRANGEVIKQR